MRKLPIVEVEWKDANAGGGWRSREEYEKQRPSACRTAGYLLVRNRQHVIIIQSQDNKGVADSITIPRSEITSIKRLT